MSDPLAHLDGVTREDLESWEALSAFVERELVRTRPEPPRDETPEQRNERLGKLRAETQEIVGVVRLALVKRSWQISALQDFLFPPKPRPVEVVESPQRRRGERLLEGATLHVEQDRQIGDKFYESAVTSLVVTSLDAEGKRHTVEARRSQGDFERPWPAEDGALSSAADRLRESKTIGEVLDVLADLYAALPPIPPPPER